MSDTQQLITVQHPLDSINWHFVFGLHSAFTPQGDHMTAPASPSILSQKQRRRLFRLFRDEIIAWLCCLRTLISGEQSTSEFLIAVEPLPDNFPFYVDAIRRRFPIADKRRPDRRVVFDVELEFRVRDVTSEPMVWVLRMTPDWGSTQGIHEPSLSDHPQVSFLGIFEIPLSAIEDAHRTFAIDSDLVLEGISCSVANGECVYLLSEISGWPTRSPLSAQNASEPQAHKAFFLIRSSTAREIHEDKVRW
ncbi:hypothetical protein C8F01DRAFT_1264522 [Mycena amicta]|nr:hypothetical protein C8F01DRAFT_1264522 [Mycena amicta]